MEKQTSIEQANVDVLKLVAELRAVQRTIEQLRESQESMRRQLQQTMPVRAEAKQDLHRKDEWDQLERYVGDAILQHNRPTHIATILEYLDAYHPDIIPLNIIDRSSYLKRRLKVVMLGSKCPFTLENTAYGHRYVFKSWE